MLAVGDVERAGQWCGELLGAERGHGGQEYEQLLIEGEIVLQRHRLGVEHHHGAIGDPGLPLGN